MLQYPRQKPSLLIDISCWFVTPLHGILFTGLTPRPLRR